jgi:hypothetical protein
MFVGSYDSKVYAFGTSFSPESTSNQPTNQPSPSSSTSPLPSSSTEPSALEITTHAWAPPPVNTAEATIVTVGAVAAMTVVVAAVTSAPVSVSSGFLDKLLGKIRELIPDTAKKWIESFIKSKNKLKIEEKQGSPFIPTKSEIIVYVLSILLLTFSFAYVKVATLNEFLVVLPTFIITSLIVSLVKTYLVTVYTRRHGVWAEYKLWYFGLAMFLISTVAFRVPFSSPTRKVNHSKNFTDNIGFRLSLAGIFLTLSFAAFFFALMISGFTLIGSSGLAMCLISAFFDTFPIKPMGGADLFKYNRIAWAGVFFGTLALYVIWIVTLAG